MTRLSYLLILLALAVVGVACGLAVEGWRAVRSRGATTAARRGRGLTVPMLVCVAGDNRRAYGVVDGRWLRIIGPRTSLALDGATYAAARHRRLRVDEELIETSLQRGYVDAAGTTYLVGAYEDWETALSTALDRARPAARWRLWAAATPRGLAAACAAAALALLASQGVWAAGHDATATMIGVVREDSVESCAVEWVDGSRPEYAEVDCYEPFPGAGAPVVVRALAWPFDESAMDHEGSYDVLTTVLGGLCLVLGAITAGVAVTRVRRAPAHLVPIQAPSTASSQPDAAHAPVDAGDSLPALLSALSAVEMWEDGVTPAPAETRFQPVTTALSSARWWPPAAMAGAALLIEQLPEPVRLALALGAGAALLWACHQALSMWFALRPAYHEPVTSEWDYRLIRRVSDSWAALLFLGDRPHWLIELRGEGHPAPVGTCGVRGDLLDGGVVRLLIDGGLWMAAGLVRRVDDDLLGQIREDVLDRLGDRGQPGAIQDGPLPG